MLRLLLSAAVLAPVIYMGLSAGAETDIKDFGLPAYSEFIDTKVNALANCEAAEVPIYFHDALIESHSAEHITAAASALAHCVIDTVYVTVFNEDMSSDDVKILVAVQSGEVKHFLVDNGVSEGIRFEYSQEIDTAYLNGRTALVKFTFQIPPNP